MSRIVPSQAVQMIDVLFSQFKDQNNTQEGRVSLHLGDASKVLAILDLIERIPNDLLILEPTEYSQFLIAISVLKNQVDEWNSRGNTGKLTRISGLGELNPITIVRRALVQCADEAIYTESNELDYISDIKLRDNIWGDISGVRRALANQEWKAATVLAGSAIEALLLWSLSAKSEVDIKDVVTSLITSGIFDKKPAKLKENWNLYQYIFVCQELELISDKTKTQALLAKDFRNLIHPGRYARLGQICDRGTAFTAVAGIENVLRDLDKNNRGK